MLIACALHAQTKQPEIKPSVRLEQPEILAILSQIDTVSTIIIRSDMVKQERNNSADRLNAIRGFLISRYEQQNPVKRDSVERKGGK